MYTSFTSEKKMHTKNNKNSSTQRNKLSFQNPTLKAPEARPETSGRRPSFAITEPAIPAPTRMKSLPSERAMAPVSLSKLASAHC